jgi:hypothetical protein
MLLTDHVTNYIKYICYKLIKDVLLMSLTHKIRGIGFLASRLIAIQMFSELESRIERMLLEGWYMRSYLIFALDTVNGGIKTKVLVLVFFFFFKG